MMDCDFEDYDTRTPLTSSSAVKTKPLAAMANKRCTENQHTSKANLAKKPKTERDHVVKNGIMDLVDDVDFDDDDFDWQTSLSSVYQTKRKEITPAKSNGEELSKETRTLSSKLCKKAALTNQQRKIENAAAVQETDASCSSLAFADRVGMRSVVSVVDDGGSCSTGSIRSQREASCLAMPAVTARPQSVSQMVVRDGSVIDQRRKALSSDNVKGDLYLCFVFLHLL